MILVIARAIIQRDSCALILATMIRKWGYQMKMSKPCLFVAGVVFFALVLVAADAFLPLWLGDENGVIENLQVVILAVAMYVCWRKMSLGGEYRLLWLAGVLTTLLMIGRELSWGRVFLEPLEGGGFPPVEALAYGKVLYPAIGILMVVILVLLARGHIVRYLRTYGLSRPRFCWMVVAAVVVVLSEKHHVFPWEKGMLIEEMAELFVYGLYLDIIRRMPSR